MADEVITAANALVASRGLRRTAAALGVPYATLQAYLAGRTPGRDVRARLEAWYAAMAARTEPLPDAPDVETLRAGVREIVAATSARVVARNAGVSTAVIRKLDSRLPIPRSLSALRRWYPRRHETAEPWRRPALDALRDAVERAVRARSLRRVSREIGITHGAVMLFIGGSKPRTTTLRKLHAWYVREGTRKAVELPDDVTRAALGLLLEPFLGKAWENVVSRITGVVRQAAGETGIQTPGWAAEGGSTEPPKEPGLGAGRAC